MTTLATLSARERRIYDLREILELLAMAGWRHSLQVGTALTGSGLPEHVHRWQRGGAYIEVVYDRLGPLEYLRYEPDPATDFSGMLIGVEHVAARSLTGLFKIAAAAGVFSAAPVAEPVALPAAA